VRASAPNSENAVSKSGENPWSALRAARANFSIPDEMRVMEWLYDSARTYFIKNS
jgi:hypothetical protein